MRIVVAFVGDEGSSALHSALRSAGCYSPGFEPLDWCDKYRSEKAASHSDEDILRFLFGMPTPVPEYMIEGRVVSADAYREKISGYDHICVKWRVPPESTHALSLATHVVVPFRFSTDRVMSLYVHAIPDLYSKLSQFARAESGSAAPTKTLSLDRELLAACIREHSEYVSGHAVRVQRYRKRCLTVVEFDYAEFDVDGLCQTLGLSRGTPEYRKKSFSYVDMFPEDIAEINSSLSKIPL